MGKRRIYKACVKVYGAAHPDPSRLEHWCPVTKAYINDDATCVVYFIGATNCTTGFDAKISKELRTVQNSMLMSTGMARKFVNHRIGLVPNVKDSSSADAMRIWSQTEPKQYKIRVFDPEYEDMQYCVPERGDLRYRDLDGEPVEWKTAARPRVRYIWAHYTCCVVKKARRTLTMPIVIETEYPRQYSPGLGPWYRKRSLLAAVDGLGPQYRQLFMLSDEPTTVESFCDNPFLEPQESLTEDYQAMSDSDYEDEIFNSDGEECWTLVDLAPISSKVKEFLRDEWLERTVEEDDWYIAIVDMCP